jgi:cellulose synthase/poly-beta-1,6-N-acetylglucosamine synthase-like glycosyltransferase
MTILALILVLVPPVLFVYAYVVYPALLWLLGLGAERAAPIEFTESEWPTVTITLPVYNEARNIRHKLDELLRLDYPAEKLQLLVISDASTDETDDIVREYEARGVQLVRLATRRGKTAAENAAGVAAHGSIIVNNDATVGLPSESLKILVGSFADPSVGVASGRDVSIGHGTREDNRGESKYVGYEMWLRGLETRIGSIVGASGCFYGIRAQIYDANFPEELSRDFASALMARAHGLRAVSVDNAICYVPRAGGLANEFRRKIRTMARGLETLWRWRRMMNPAKYGAFALMLISHKLCRWLVYLFVPVAFFGLAVFAVSSPHGAVAFGVGILGVAAGALAWHHTQAVPRVNRIVSLTGFAFASVAAGMLAWAKVLRRQQSPIWEPTRRPTVESTIPSSGSMLVQEPMHGVPRV